MYIKKTPSPTLAYKVHALCSTENKGTLAQNNYVTAKTHR